ncbi:MAG: peptidase E [Patulibacter sp.]
MSGPGPVFCMGGGGFTMELGMPALDAFILALAPVERPRVLFLPTAGGDPREDIARFGRVFGAWPCRPQILSLFRIEADDEPLESLILSQDIIYVGGGSLHNLLALWRAHGVADLMLEANARGTVLAGLSAGAMCWMEGGVSTSVGIPAPIDGLGLVSGSLSVHARQEPERGVVYRQAVQSGRLPAGWTADDGCGLLFRDGRLEEVVVSREDAVATHVDVDADGMLVETVLEGRRLEPVPQAVGGDGPLRREFEPGDGLGPREERRLVRQIRARTRAGGSRGWRRLR